MENKVMEDKLLKALSNNKFDCYGRTRFANIFKKKDVYVKVYPSKKGLNIRIKHSPVKGCLLDDECEKVNFSDSTLLFENISILDIPIIMKTIKKYYRNYYNYNNNFSWKSYINALSYEDLINNYHEISKDLFLNFGRNKNLQKDLEWQLKYICKVLQRKSNAEIIMKEVYYG